MNAEQMKLDDSDPVHQQLEELAWLARDLQQRARLQRIPELAYTRAAEIAEHAARIKDYFDALRQEDTQPAEQDEEGNQVDRTFDAPEEQPSFPEQPQQPVVNNPPAKKPKGGRP